MDLAALHDPVATALAAPPRLLEPLKRLKIERVIDLLNWFPRSYHESARIRDLKAGQNAVVTGRVVSATNKATQRRRMKITEVLIEDDSGTLKAVFFNQPWLTGKFREGVSVKLTGPVDFAYGQWSMKPSSFVVNPEDEPKAGLIPEYPLTDGIASEDIARLATAALARFADAVPDPLPPALARARRLMPLPEAYRQAHQPAGAKPLAAALLALKYREFFLLQCGLRLRRRSEQGDSELAIRVDDDLRARAMKYFPFEFTGAQKRVCAEIEGDLTRPGRMHRLLQGDVGSGKTAVALYASLLMVGSGWQCAWLAPTEVLARQHFATLTRLLADTRVKVRLLMGGMDKPERKVLLEGLASGHVHIVVGTHALLEPDVEFAKLGFCVIDEQHKFGVNQRAQLRRKGRRPHVLAMSATPIPRTLSMSLYGGLDVSVIDELPPGRTPVTTDWVHENRAAKTYETIRAELKAGGRAYFIYPLVEAGESTEARSAVEFAERLKNETFPEFKVGLVHGQMPADEKDRVMRRFREGDLHILAATVVVEVGVDVPEANIMVIENAERFGLAQLHQLRGRIGRGARKSWLFLFGEPRTEESIQRLNILCQTNDGFRIAEEDLRMRGFGDFAGTRQSGLPKLHIGDFERDLEVLAAARKDAATEALAVDEAMIRDCLELHFGRSFRLMDV